MAFNEADSIRRRIETLKRRKGFLEVHLARQGYNTDPSIQMEIEDIGKDIEELQSQLNITSSESAYQQSMNLMSILAGIIERMEHVNQGMITLKLEHRRLRQKHYMRPSYTMDMAISELNKDEEYIRIVELLKGRIESFAAFYRINKFYIPPEIEKHVLSYRTDLLGFVFSSQNVEQRIETMIHTLEAQLQGATTAARSIQQNTKP